MAQADDGGPPAAAAAADSSSPQEKARRAVQASQHGAKAKEAATSLREKAAKIRDPRERRRVLQEAYDKEVEAFGQTKLARRMQSGAWQGAVGGVGIGGGVGMGVGTAVGTLVGGVVSLPTTALGGLIGTGVGALHGPFIKLNPAGGKEAKEKEEQQTTAEEEIKKSEEAARIEEAHSQEAQTQLRAEIDAARQETGAGDAADPGKTPTGDRRRPRKLETRKAPSAASPEGTDKGHSHGAARKPLTESAGNGNTTATRKKPKKLEVRSVHKGQS